MSQLRYQEAALPEESAQIPLTHLLRCSTADARKLLPGGLARKYCCLPLGIHRTRSEEFLNVLLAEPMNEVTIREIQFIVGLPVIATAVNGELLRKATALLYASDEAQLVEQKTVSTGGAENDDIARLAKAVLLYAIRQRCSDIHIEHEYERALLRFRLRGELLTSPTFTPSKDEVIRLCRHIKVCANLDSTGLHLPQDGAFELYNLGLEIRVRVSCLPTSVGEKIVLRLLHNGCLEDIAQGALETQLSVLGIFPEQLVEILRFIDAERGSLLVSGPTGSGKSTFLYTLVRALSTSDRNVISLEDPVEARIEHACQVDLSTIKKSFEEMLPRILRQDPDVLLVGEVRTSEAAHTTLQAALAGTKVLASIHAGSCFEVLIRLRELGISNTLIGLTLRLVSSQRLLPRVCEYCAYEVKADLRLQSVFQLDPETSLTQCAGCARCHEAGSIAVFEFLNLSEPLRAILRSSEGDYMLALAKQAYHEGYRSYGYYVRELLLKRRVTAEVARRAIGA